MGIIILGTSFWLCRGNQILNPGFAHFVANAFIRTVKEDTVISENVIRS
jgi:hypothetical protein